MCSDFWLFLYIFFKIYIKDLLTLFQYFILINSYYLINN